MTQEKLFILSFSDIRATDLSLGGGKGANLGEFSQWILTSTSFPSIVQKTAFAPDLRR